MYLTKKYCSWQTRVFVFWIYFLELCVCALYTVACVISSLKTCLFKLGVEATVPRCMVSFLSKVVPTRENLLWNGLPLALHWPPRTGMHNPRAGSGPQTCYIRPSEQFKNYKKLHLNEEDFMNEFKFHWTVNNFATYYNPKKLWWQEYQTTSNK